MSLLRYIEDFKEGHMRLVLGSGSRPRRQLLEQLGIPFDVMVSEYSEDLDKALFHGDAYEYSLATSREKMNCLLQSEALMNVDKPTIVITCDTVVLRDEQHIIEKPDDAAHAFEIIKSLSGIQHHVVTGVVISLIQPGGAVMRTEFKSISSVRFAKLSDDEIRAYVSTEEYHNKAGGYGVQGLAAILVESIDGSFSNVVGLPVFEVSVAVARLLDQICYFMYTC